MRRSPRLVAPTLLAAVLLTGCLAPDPVPTPPPTDAAPVFASDEEALAAAEEAYGRYLAVVDAIFSEGGASPERLLAHVSEDVYEQELPGFERIASNGWRGTGSTSFALTLQSFDDATVVVYSCDDVSSTDLLDASGRSIVKEGRLEHVPFEVVFDPADEMRIVGRQVWEGSGVC